MIRAFSFLAVALMLALPAQALPFTMTLPNLTYPDPVATPSTKGCDTEQTTSACPGQN